jgi:hypothetical protein
LHLVSAGKLKIAIPVHCVKVSLRVKRVAGKSKMMTCDTTVKRVQRGRGVVGRLRSMMQKRCALLRHARAEAEKKSAERSTTKVHFL